MDGYLSDSRYFYPCVSLSLSQEPLSKNYYKYSSLKFDLKFFFT